MTRLAACGKSPRTRNTGKETGLTPTNPSTLLQRLGLDRRELRAWALYDLANSAFVTTVVVAVFPIYFSSVAAADLPPAVATARFAMATAVAMAVVAVLAPFLGNLADVAAMKKKLLAAFLVLGVGATGGMVFVHRGDWMLAAGLFMAGNVGIAGTFIFYDALLPHVARPGEMDRVSSAGYALGYLGGGLLLAVNLAWIQFPASFGMADSAAASRWAFLSVALWWALFSLPLFRLVPEPPPLLSPCESGNSSAMRGALGRLLTTLRDLRAYPQAFLLLVAFLIYNDGIGTVGRMAAVYGTELGIGQGVLIGAILMVQFLGVPFAFLFGGLASRIGAKRSVLLGLAVYAGVTVLGYYMRTAAHFIALAVLVGMVQGGCQALSRSLFASMIPRHRSAEFFAFFAVFEKIAGILGPAVFAGILALTGSSRNAILAVIAFFIAGGALLSFVNVPEGQRLARRAERALADAG